MPERREKSPKDLSTWTLVEMLLEPFVGPRAARDIAKRQAMYDEFKTELFKRLEPRCVLLQHRKGAPLRTYWATLSLNFSTENEAYLTPCDNDGMPLEGGCSFTLPWREALEVYEPVKNKKQRVSRPVLARPGTRQGGMTVA